MKQNRKQKKIISIIIGLIFIILLSSCSQKTESTERSINNQQDIYDIDAGSILTNEAITQAQVKREQLRQEALKLAEEKKLAEEQAIKEAEEKKFAEEQAAKEAEEKKLAEEQAAKEAEEKKLAEEQAAKEAEEKKLAEEQAAKEAEEKISGGNNSSNGNSENFNTYDNTAQQQTSANYVLNTNTHKFHQPSCKSVKKIAPQNYSTSNASRDEIIMQGYEPCKNCNP